MSLIIKSFRTANIQIFVELATSLAKKIKSRSNYILIRFALSSLLYNDENSEAGTRRVRRRCVLNLMDLQQL